MSKLCPLFSGSDGNVTYISALGGGILVDAGASYKGICEALERSGGSILEIRAVAVTHEHSDHIKGLKTLLTKTKIPLIASAVTAETLVGMDVVPSETKIIIADQNKTEISGLMVSRFATSHDCEGSSGYVVTLPDGMRIGVCTDLGVVTDEVRAALIGCKAVLIESNHDLKMLKQGPYPAQLKMRIMSEKGHLSNNSCAAELPQLLKSGTDRIILGHISKNNNMPMLALSSARATLADIGAQNGIDYILSAAKPFGNGVTAL